MNEHCKSCIYYVIYDVDNEPMYACDMNNKISVVNFGYKCDDYVPKIIMKSE